MFWLFAGIAGLICIGAMVYIRTVRHDDAVWHVDPLAFEGTGRPNDYLVAPEGQSARKPDQPAPEFTVDAAKLAALWAEMAEEKPRTELLAGSVAGGHLTHVTRSALMGYPDYISARFISLDAGRATLAVYSRSRFGHSDLGANKARVADWLATLSARVDDGILP